MATKKKTKQKQAKSNRTAGKKVTLVRKSVKKKLAKKRVTPKEKLAKKAAPRKAAVKTGGAPRRQVREKNQSVNTVGVAREGQGARAGEQAGDLQGLSNVAAADSESVDELIEEGNAFEAEVVKGVEDAGDADEGEVHTHEVPQDDVPGEYLDKK